jgi:hypothetical protein
MPWPTDDAIQSSTLQAERNTTDQCRAAARTVAVNALDTNDCTELLAMLGLTAQEGTSHG